MHVHLIAYKHFLLLYFFYIFYSEEENFLDNVQSRKTVFLIDCGTYVFFAKGACLVYSAGTPLTGGIMVAVVVPVIERVCIMVGMV